MDIRKLIREELESFFDQDKGAGIVGTDIVGYLHDLPETRDEVNWAHPRTFYALPSLDNSNAHTEVYDKEFFTGWDRPYMRQGKPVPHSGEGYVAEFQKRYGENPIFKINGRKIEILNPKFNSGQDNQTARPFGSLD